MIKCLLIYLWIYMGFFYMIEAGSDDEHVHIKLHMSGGQRKRAQIHQHGHSHHKKRHTGASPQHQHRHQQQQHSQPMQPPPSTTTTTTNLYHESPHNYFTGITATSSSSLLPQNHVFQPTHTRKLTSSSLLNLHESGQLLNMEEDAFGREDIGGDESIASVDADDAGERMKIPSYMTKNFALFPHPTTTYETEIIPHISEGFNVVSGSLDGPEYIEEENEISMPVGKKNKATLESIILAEHMENYPRLKPSSTSSPSSTSLLSSSSAKSIKQEQLLKQLLQQQNNERPEMMNAAAYKSVKLRANKHKAQKEYLGEDDVTEAMMYSPATMGEGHNPAEPFNRPREEFPYNGSGNIKTLTVDDIWSQLQQQYLSKYTPQAQPLTPTDSDERPLTATPTKLITKPKSKRNTKRQRHAKPTTSSSYSISWPAKPLSSYTSNSHHNKLHLPSFKQHQQQQHFYDDIHLPPSAAAFGSASLSSHREPIDFFAKQPFTKLNIHNDEDDTDETADETLGEFSEEEDDDDFDAYGDESFEEAVYQRGKKFTGHTAYGQHNAFHHNHDLYGSYSTPITATVASNTNNQPPTTYHPSLLSTTLPSYTSTAKNAFLPTLSHPSTSYQWRTQQNYPSSYQTYHLQHKQQPPQWPAEEHYARQQSSTALRLPKATIIQTPNAISTSKLSPTQSNDFTVSSSSASASASPSAPSTSSSSTSQAPARYKKRKNRIKPKRNRIVVI